MLNVGQKMAKFRYENRLTKGQILVTIVFTSLCWICVDLYLFYKAGLDWNTDRKPRAQIPEPHQNIQFQARDLSDDDRDLNVVNRQEFVPLKEDKITQEKSKSKRHDFNQDPNVHRNIVTLKTPIWPNPNFVAATIRGERVESEGRARGLSGADKAVEGIPKAAIMLGSSPNTTIGNNSRIRATATRHPDVEKNPPPGDKKSDHNESQVDIRKTAASLIHQTNSDRVEYLPVSDL